MANLTNLSSSVANPTILGLRLCLFVCLLLATSYLSCLPFCQSYEDSKPLTSPMPTPSTTASATKPIYVDAKPEVSKSTPLPEPAGIIIEKEPTQTEVRKPRPLSHYTC